MNFMQFAVWGSYLTSMGTYLFSIGTVSYTHLTLPTILLV